MKFRQICLGLSGLSAVVLAAPGWAQPSTGTAAPLASAADQQTGGEEVMVRSKPHTQPGGGLMTVSNAVKNVETTSREFILKQPPTTNPIRLLEMQPGAVVSSPDPFGLNPGSINIRGLNNNEVAWQFEGAPLNDGTLYPNEVVDAPNLEQVSLIPGAGDFDLPAVSSAAGAVQILLHDPSHTPGGMVNLSYGSYDFHNEFIRLETGDIGKTGIRAFASFSDAAGNDWRSAGQDTRNHVDAKAIKDWGNGSQSALSIAYSDVNFQVERAPTLTQWEQQGVSFNYDRTFTKGDTNFYRLHQNPYKNIFLAAPNTIIVNPRLTYYANPYGYTGQGTIPGATVLNPSSAYIGTQKVNGLQVANDGAGTGPNAVLLNSSQVPSLARVGINQNLKYEVDRHNTITAGWWYEYSERHTQAGYTYVGPTGVPENVWSDVNYVQTPRGHAYIFTNYLVRAQTNDLYIGDRMKYLDGRLAIDYGIRDVMFTQHAYNRIPGTTYNISNSQFEPQPSIGARYSFTPTQQIFADAGINAENPAPTQLVDVISPTTGKLTTRGGNGQKPEESIVEELGYRYTGNLVVASATLFNYNFTNRQVTTQVLQGGALITDYLNGGGQTSRGVDASAGLRPWHHLRPFVSGEFLQATIDNNIPDNGDLLRTAGKTATASPKWSGNFGLDYDQGNVFGSFSLHYVSSQYSTFTNDEKIPQFYTTDMSLGYRLPNLVKQLKHPQVMLNLVNLDDHKFLTGINSTTLTSYSKKGIYGTTLSGSNPTYLIGTGFAALVTVSTGF